MRSSAPTRSRTAGPPVRRRDQRSFTPNIPAAGCASATRLQDGVGAEVGLATATQCEAELAEKARRWAVLKIASVLSGEALDRPFALRAATPFSTRAGDLRNADRGASGLDQSFDEKDQLRLVGRRAGGDPVPGPRPERGERDQVYFALRFAYIEDYAARDEALRPSLGMTCFAELRRPAPRPTAWRRWLRSAIARSRSCSPTTARRRGRQDTARRAADIIEIG